MRPPLQTPPTPNPNPVSSQTLSAKVTIRVAVLGGASFNNQNNLTDYRASESDAFSSPSRTLTSTTDQYVNAAPIGSSTQLIEVGSRVATSTGVRTTTTIGPGNGLIDVTPEVPGPIRPANTAARNRTEVDPSGQSSSQVFHADGSYNETIKYPTGAVSTATERSDGSGAYVVPLGDISGSSAVYAAPSTGNIGITVTFAAGVQGRAASETQNIVVPAWYTNPLAAPVLYAQTFASGGAAAPPASCLTASNFTQPANALTQTTTTIDTIFGEADTLTSTSYTTQGFGVVCMVLRDTTVQYYDFTGQQQPDLLFGNVPVQTTILTETLGLQSVPSTIGAALAQLPVGPLASTVGSGFAELVARERAQRHTADLNKLRASFKLDVSASKGQP